MTSFTLAVVLQAAIAAGDQNYTVAHRQMAETGRPLVVLVGAAWCPGCRTMSHSMIPQVIERGALKNVAYAYVNTDHEGPLADRLMSGGSIPQLIMYYESPTGWQRRQLTGAQSVADIESFLKVGVDASATVRKSRAAANKVAVSEKR